MKRTKHERQAIQGPLMDCIKLLRADCERAENIFAMKKGDDTIAADVLLAGIEKALGFAVLSLIIERQQRQDTEAKS